MHENQHQGAEFIVGLASGGFADHASGGGCDPAVAGETHVSERSQSDFIEATGVEGGAEGLRL